MLPLVAGNLASGVRSLYIRFGAAENNFVGCNEIDVFGAAPPATNDYASWASANGVTGGVNGDSDNDGIKNLVEYALADGTSGTYTGGTLSFTKRGGISALTSPMPSRNPRISQSGRRGLHPERCDDFLRLHRPRACEKVRSSQSDAAVMNCKAV